MKKAIAILGLFLIFLLFSCTQAGIEWGLIGNWTITKADAELGIHDIEGDLTINSNDTFSMNLKFENSSDWKIEYDVSGTIAGNYQNKIFYTSTTSVTFKINGVKQTPQGDSYYDAEASYILNGNTLTADVDLGDSNFDLTFTKQ